MQGAVVMVLVLLLVIGVTVYLAGTMVRSIQNERRAPMRLWKNFGLSMGFCLLFFLSLDWSGRSRMAVLYR